MGRIERGRINYGPKANKSLRIQTQKGLTEKITGTKANGMYPSSLD